MSNENLKLALMQTAPEMILNEIPEKLPEAEVSNKFEQRVEGIFKKKPKKPIWAIVAAIAIVLLVTPLIANHIKNENMIEGCEVEIITGCLPAQHYEDNNDVSIKEDNLVVEITTTVSKESSTEQNMSAQQSNVNVLEILRNIKDFDDYDVYLNSDNGKDVVQYTEDESLEIMKEYLDTDFVIFEKVKFSKKYLRGIQKFLSDYMGDEYTIYGVGSGSGEDNKVVIDIADKSKIKEILELLYENYENFDKDAIKFDVYECEVRAY